MNIHSFTVCARDRLYVVIAPEQKAEYWGGIGYVTPSQQIAAYVTACVMNSCAGHPVAPVNPVKTRIFHGFWMSARRPGSGRPTCRILASLADLAGDDSWSWLSPGGVTRPISEGAFPEMGVVSHRGTESTQGWKPGKPFLAKDAKVAKVRKDWVEGSKYLDVSWQSLRTWREIMPGFGFCREGAPGLPLTGPPCANPGRFASGGVPG